MPSLCATQSETTFLAFSFAFDLPLLIARIAKRSTLPKLPFSSGAPNHQGTQVCMRNANVFRKWKLEARVTEE